VKSCKWQLRPHSPRTKKGVPDSLGLVHFDYLKFITQVKKNDGGGGVRGYWEWPSDWYIIVTACLKGKLENWFSLHPAYPISKVNNPLKKNSDSLLKIPQGIQVDAKYVLFW